MKMHLTIAGAATALFLASLSAAHAGGSTTPNAPTTVPVNVQAAVLSAMRIQGSAIPQGSGAQFQSAFISDLAALLGVHANNIRVMEMFIGRADNGDRTAIAAE